MRSRKAIPKALLALWARIRPAHWLFVSSVILLVDYLTGPFIRFPILFVVPVALATQAHGPVVGGCVAAVLPLTRLWLFYGLDAPGSEALEVIDALVDVMILIAFSALLHLVLLQRRKIRVLEGMLPICSFCKRIRDEEGQWRKLEAFITDRSGARFSHTFCEECARSHYPDLLD